MKYYNTINSKLKIFLTGMYLFFSFGLSAQLSTQSPYSGFGVGELHSGNSVSAFGLGGVSTGWKDAYLINSSNPASYSFLHTTTFQIDGFSKVNNLSNSTGTEQVNTSGLDNVNFVFKKRNSASSFALGLRKFSSTGYQIIDSLSTPDFNVDYYYEGSGGINNFNMGYAYVFKIKKFNGLLEPNPSLDSLDREKLYVVRHKLSFGANFDWMFGVINHLKRTRFDNTTFLNTLINRDFQVNDYNFTLGIQGSFNLYQKGILKRETNREKLDLIFGVSYALNNDIQFKETYSALAIPSQGSATIISLNEDQPGYFSLPQKINLGMSLVFEKNGRILQWGIDYKEQDWSSYKMVVGDETISGNFAKSSSLGTGLEITPMSYDKSTNYFGLMTYRMGVRTAKTYWFINDVNIDEKAVTAGLSLPLLGSKSFSKLNFGMEIGTRGSTDVGLIQEKFTNFMVGFTFTPHYYNRWFVVRKYD